MKNLILWFSGISSVAFKCEFPPSVLEGLTFPEHGFNSKISSLNSILKSIAFYLLVFLPVVSVFTPDDLSSREILGAKILC